MKVLRAELGLSLFDAREAFQRLRQGEYIGTLAEMAQLARKFESSGVAVSARPAAQENKI